jgi:hypothetical protein
MLDDVKSRKLFQPGYRSPDPYGNWDPEKDFNPTAPRQGGPAPSKKTGAAAPGAAGAARLGDAAQAAPATGPVTVKTPEDAMKLPKGTVFMTPDGRRKVAPGPPAAAAAPSAAPFTDNE